MADDLRRTGQREGAQSEMVIPDDQLAVGVRPQFSGMAMNGIAGKIAKGRS